MKTTVDRENFGEWISQAADCRNVVFQALDLREHDSVLAALPQAASADEGCLFLGCVLGPELAERAGVHHGLIFPDLPGYPYKPFRHRLYTVDELFAGFDPRDPASYFITPDWLTYVSYIKVDEFNKPIRPVRYVDAETQEVLARRLHDHFVEQEAEEFLDRYRWPAGRGIVAIMGGHDRLRSDAIYSEIAHMARDLTRDGLLVASGGGPGLMEASNLGAWFAAWDDPAVLDEAILRLKRADRYDHPEWLQAAWEVRDAFPSPDPEKSRSLGLPTWFYGHEPPNVFSTHIAKYFENSIREEGLLAIATHGVIFAEGNAGTVQEIFQDACQNYYENYGLKSPMILFGSDYWNPDPGQLADPGSACKPAWPLLRQLAREKGFPHLLTLTSSVEEAKAKILEFRPPGEL